MAAAAAAASVLGSVLSSAGLWRLVICPFASAQSLAELVPSVAAVSIQFQFRQSMVWAVLCVPRLANPKIFQHKSIRESLAVNTSYSYTQEHVHL